jgi:hypothetical protein
LHRFRELDALKKPKISESGGGTSRDSSASPSSAAAGGQTTESNGFKIPDVPKPATAAGGEAIEDWTGEVRDRHCHKYCTSFSRSSILGGIPIRIRNLIQDYDSKN